MSDNKSQIERLGFEAWADNVIVNLIENFGDKIDEESYSLRIEKYPSETSYIVHAYVPGKGWLTHTRTIKKPKEEQS